MSPVPERAMIVGGRARLQCRRSSSECDAAQSVSVSARAERGQDGDHRRRARRSRSSRPVVIGARHSQAVGQGRQPRFSHDPHLAWSPDRRRGSVRPGRPSRRTTSMMSTPAMMSAIPPTIVGVRVRRREPCPMGRPRRPGRRPHAVGDPHRHAQRQRPRDQRERGATYPMTTGAIHLRLRKPSEARMPSVESTSRTMPPTSVSPHHGSTAGCEPNSTIRTLTIISPDAGHDRRGERVSEDQRGPARRSPRCPSRPRCHRRHRSGRRPAAPASAGRTTRLQPTTTTISQMRWSRNAQGQRAGDLGSDRSHQQRPFPHG